jgi:type IV pilus assembly protein PilO
MDRFNKLPFPAKLGILIAALGAIAGLFYYTMITPIDESLKQSKGKENGLKAELEKLQKEAEAVKPDELVQRKLKLEKERLGYEELLPKTEELVKFISGLSETAKTAGLELISFEKGLAEERNFYMQIPIKMGVQGTYRELIGFFRAIAEVDRRVVNIANLKITSNEPDVSPYLIKYQEQRADSIPTGFILRPLTPTQLAMDKLRAYDEIVAGGIAIDASFTAYVFLYTGKEMDPAVKVKLDLEQANKTKKLTQRRAVPQ